MDDPKQQLYEHLEFIYGEALALPLAERITDKLTRFRQVCPDPAATSPKDRFNERDCILITYGDMVKQAGEHPLETLGDFLRETLAETISTVHILPFYPVPPTSGPLNAAIHGQEPLTLSPLHEMSVLP